MPNVWQHRILRSKMLPKDKWLGYFSEHITPIKALARLQLPCVLFSIACLFFIDCHGVFLACFALFYMFSAVWSFDIVWDSWSPKPLFAIKPYTTQPTVQKLVVCINCFVWQLLPPLLVCCFVLAGSFFYMVCFLSFFQYRFLFFHCVSFFLCLVIEETIVNLDHWHVIPPLSLAKLKNKLNQALLWWWVVNPASTPY